MKRTFLFFIGLCISVLLNAQVSKTVNVTAGSLFSALTSEEKNTVTNLIVTGTIDARDFKTMRDNMPALAVLNIGGAVVVGYTGTQGTAGTISVTYPGNEIPEYAFCDTDDIGKSSLTAVTFPASITAIGYRSLSNCTGLTLVTIPSSVKTIGKIAFYGDSGINSFIFESPSSLTTIGRYAFGFCYSLTSFTIFSSVTLIEDVAFLGTIASITVDAGNPNYSSIDGALFNKDQTRLMYFPVTKPGSYTIPSTVTTIGIDAFYACVGLSSITIPSSVTIIEDWAFENCTGLTSIYANMPIPVDLSSSPDVFFNVNKTTCTLHVPFGSSSLYAAADQWKDFTNITEMSGFKLSAAAASIAASQGSTASVVITSDTNWSASSDQTWLTVSPTSGTGNNTLIFTAEANPLVTDRTALVTVSSTGVDSKTISITQQATRMHLTVFLEGAYTGSGLMKTTLYSASLIPLSQPYNVAPWNYTGTEHVAAIPAGVVDWVLVELRDAATAVTALPATKLAGWPKAYFLKSDGTIVDLDGTSLPGLGNPAITNNLYVIIRHRNHIDIMSANGVTLTGNNYVYNFTDAISKAYGGSAGYKEIASGVFGMVSGDADADGDISVLDFTEWANDFGKTTIYLPSDIDTDGEVSVLDFSKWATNFGVGNIAPLKKMILNGSDRKYKSQVPRSQ